MTIEVGDEVLVRGTVRSIADGHMCVRFDQELIDGTGTHRGQWGMTVPVSRRAVHCASSIWQSVMRTLVIRSARQRCECAVAPTTMQFIP